MKKIIILLIISISTFINAQDKRFTFALRTELADKNTHNENFDYGFNVGAEMSYQMSIVYFNAEIYHFPNLNDLDYTHFQSTLLGFNHHSKFENWRYYLGAIKLGLIYRPGPYPMFGQDVGIEHYFDNGSFIGFGTGYDIKTDSHLWNIDNHTVFFATLKFGVQW